MKVFRIKYTAENQMNVDIEADSKEEAKQKFDNGEYEEEIEEYCMGLEVISIKEVKE